LDVAGRRPGEPPLGRREIVEEAPPELAVLREWGFGEPASAAAGVAQKR
jgi:hypothetical protein